MLTFFTQLSFLNVNLWNFQVIQMVKNPLAVQETRLVRTLGQEAPLEKAMAIHSSMLAWRIPGTEEPGGLQSIGHKKSDTTE